MSVLAMELSSMVRAVCGRWSGLSRARAVIAPERIIHFAFVQAMRPRLSEQEAAPQADVGAVTRVARRCRLNPGWRCV